MCSADNQQVKSREALFHLGAKTALINEDGKVLVLKCEGKKNYLDFPGGRIHSSETLEEVARREIFEETGIKGDFALRYLGMCKTPISFELKPEGVPCGVIYALFTARIHSQEITLSDEHQGYEWMDLRYMKEYLSAWEPTIKPLLDSI